MQTLTGLQQETLLGIQRKIRAMLAERQQSIQDDPFGWPSSYWTDCTSSFDYMRDLSPHSLAKVRLHTYHLTGDNYQTYNFGNRRGFLDFYGPWLATDGLPAEHVLSEPEDGIGFRLEDGRFVSADIARFQRSVTTLSRRGVLAELTRFRSPPRIIEIGGGYGGLALHLSRILAGCRYFLVDLPETLVFSASYLVLQAPAKRLYLYDPADRLDAESLAAFDLVLMPDYRLDALTGFEFDLAINVASMQEMRVDQIERYLDFIGMTCRGVFYSCNRDRQHRNDELSSLFDLLRTRFELTEVPPSSVRPSSWKDRTRRRLRRMLRRGPGGRPGRGREHGPGRGAVSLRRTSLSGSSRGLRCLKRGVTDFGEQPAWLRIKMASTIRSAWSPRTHMPGSSGTTSPVIVSRRTLYAASECSTWLAARATEPLHLPRPARPRSWESIVRPTSAHARRKYGLDARVGDAQALPLPDRSIELVVSFETIEHVDDPAAFMGEVARVLVPEGIWIVSTPNRPVYSPKGTQNPYHRVEFDERELIELLRFRFQAVRIYTQFPQSAAWWSYRSLAAERSPWLRIKGYWRLSSWLCPEIRTHVSEAVRARADEIILARNRFSSSLFNPYIVRPRSASSRERPYVLVAVAEGVKTNGSCPVPAWDRHSR